LPHSVGGIIRKSGGGSMTAITYTASPFAQMTALAIPEIQHQFAQMWHSAIAAMQHDAFKY
jgi:molybdopterin synthase catalytic subunit